MKRSDAVRVTRFGLGAGLLAALVIAWTMYRHAGADMPVPAELTVFVAFIIGGSGVLIAYGAWRTLRLGADRHVVARWTLPPDQWERYVAACRMRETMPGAFAGSVPLDLPVSFEGIEVLALRRGFRVGESFHEVGGLGAEVLDVRVVAAPAPMFEFNIRYPTGRTSSVLRGVRIPIAAGAESLAHQVEDYWIAREPLQVMTVEQLRARERSGWTIALLGGVAFLGILALFVVISPPGWAALGPISALGVAGYGFVRALRAHAVRSRKER